MTSVGSNFLSGHPLGADSPHTYACIHLSPFVWMS